MNLIEELRWRGLIQDIMPGTEEQFQKEMTTGLHWFRPYCRQPAYWQPGSDYFIGASATSRT